MSANPVFVATPVITPQSWTHADSAATSKTIYTAGGSGSKVVAITAASTDTSDRVFQVYLTRSATNYLLTSATVRANSGSDGATVTTNLFINWPGLPVDNDGQVYLFLKVGDTLTASNVAQVTAAKEVDITVIGGNL